MSYQFFKDEEVTGLHPVLVGMLDMARGLSGFAFKITSGLRTQEENAVCSGVQDSSHLKGLAVDLQKPQDEFLAAKMAWALGRAGFRRIGIYDKHIHVDIDEEKTQDVAWTGISH